MTWKMKSLAQCFFFLFLHFHLTNAATSKRCAPLSPKQFQRAAQVARDWAPLIWLAPGEKYFPSSVLDFLTHTTLGSNDILDNGGHLEEVRTNRSLAETIPVGIESKRDILKTKEELASLLANTSSFLYGHSPHFYSVPVYAVISSCCQTKLKPTKPSDHENSVFYLKETRVPVNSGRTYFKVKRASSNSIFKVKRAVGSSYLKDEGRAHSESSYFKDISGSYVKDKRDSGNSIDTDFQVTFWLFFPYSEGKRVCTLSAGSLGPIPIPWLREACLGQVRKFGNHVGDWEHVTLAFKGSEAVAMYVSTHDAGALYSAPHRTARHSEDATWTYSGHELRRGARLQTPRFPRRAISLRSGRPVLFAAKGSHGLWTLPGRHKYVTFPNLADDTGFGASWKTWLNLQVLPWPPDNSTPRWVQFQGRWGNPRSGCHPLSNQVCQLNDGPTGIPTKKHAFRCLQNFAVM